MHFIKKLMFLYDIRLYGHTILILQYNYKAL